MSEENILYALNEIRATVSEMDARITNMESLLNRTHDHAKQSKEDAHEVKNKMITSYDIDKVKDKIGEVLSKLNA